MVHGTARCSDRLREKRFYHFFGSQTGAAAPALVGRWVAMPLMSAALLRFIAFLTHSRLRTELISGTLFGRVIHVEGHLQAFRITCRRRHTTRQLNRNCPHGLALDAGSCRRCREYTAQIGGSTKFTSTARSLSDSYAPFLTKSYLLSDTPSKDPILRTAHHLVGPCPASNSDRVSDAPSEFQKLVEFGRGPFEERFSVPSSARI